MTSPTVTETSVPPEPVVPDPFIDDMTTLFRHLADPVAEPPALEPQPRRRRIWD